MDIQEHQGDGAGVVGGVGTALPAWPSRLVQEDMLDAREIAQMQEELIAQDEQRDMVWKLTREIFRGCANLRFDVRGYNSAAASSVIAECQSKLRRALEITARTPHVFESRLCSAMEELAQICLLQGFFEKGKLLPLSEVQPCFDEEYINACISFAQDLSRHALTQASELDQLSVSLYYNVIKALYSQMLKVSRQASVRKKQMILLALLKRLEHVIFSMSLVGGLQLQNEAPFEALIERSCFEDVNLRLKESEQTKDSILRLCSEIHSLCEESTYLAFESHIDEATQKLIFAQTIIQNDLIPTIGQDLKLKHTSHSSAIQNYSVAVSFLCWIQSRHFATRDSLEIVDSVEYIRGFAELSSLIGRWAVLRATQSDIEGVSHAIQAQASLRGAIMQLNMGNRFGKQCEMVDNNYRKVEQLQYMLTMASIAQSHQPQDDAKLDIQNVTSISNPPPTSAPSIRVPVSLPSTLPQETSLDDGEIRQMQEELLEDDEKRDRLWKLTREVFRGCSKMLFELPGGSSCVAEPVVADCQAKLREALGLVGDRAGIRDGRLSSAIEEFTKIRLLLGIFETGTLLPFSEVQPCYDEEYLGASISVAHDISRYSLGRACEMDFASVNICRNIVSDLHKQLLKFKFRNSGGLRKKFDSLKYALKRLEDVSHTMSLISDEEQPCKRAKIDAETHLHAEVEDHSNRVDAASLEDMNIRYEEFDAKRDMIIKRCRDAQKLSKDAIYSIHQGKDQLAVSKLETALKIFNEELIPVINEHPKLRMGSFASAVEEYAEAKLFLGWMHTNTLESKASFGFIDTAEYVGALSDVTGEIGRWAVLRASERDVNAVTQALHTQGCVRSAIMRLNIANRFGKKCDAVDTNYRKTEEQRFELTMALMGRWNVGGDDEDKLKGLEDEGRVDVN